MTKPLLIHAAALTLEIELDGQAGVGLSAPSVLTLIPDGEFDAIDGRPGILEGVKAKKWVMNAKIAQNVINTFTSRGLKLVIDYDHQTLRSGTNGQPAPAAGWITALTYESGKGLRGNVMWTEDGRESVEKREYLYLSPVFPFNSDTGEVQGLHSVALTNTPAISKLGEIAAMAALSALTSKEEPRRQLPGPGSLNPQELSMDKTKILVALGLPLDTGEETALTALAALCATNRTRETEIVALKANQFDPQKHIPLEEHKKVTEQLAALQAQQETTAHAQLMTAALSDARILPANEAYWRSQSLASLQAFLKDAKPLAALSSLQTQGKAPDGTTVSVTLNAEELAVCRALGMTPEAYAKGKVTT